MPKSAKLIMPVVLGVLGIVGTIFIASAVSVFVVCSAMVNAVDQQLEFFKQRDFPDAYNLTSKEFKNDVSLEDFKLFVQRHPFFTSHISHSFSGSSLDKKTASVKVTLINSEGGSAAFIYIFYKESSEWRIDYIEPVVSGQAATPVEKPIETPIQKPAEAGLPKVKPHRGGVKGLHDAKAYIKRGNAYFKQSNFLQAISAYTKAIKINPNYAEAYSNRGFAHLKHGNLAQAISDYTKAIEIKPNLAAAYNNRGFAYVMQGNFVQAIVDYTKAIEINPRYLKAYNNRGFVYVLQDNLAQAIFDYNKAIQINPELATSYNNRGLAYFKQGDVDQAIADYTKAIEIDPNYAKAYSNRGSAYFRIKENDKAFADVRKAGILRKETILKEVQTLSPTSRESGVPQMASAQVKQIILPVSPANLESFYAGMLHLGIAAAKASSFPQDKRMSSVLAMQIINDLAPTTQGAQAISSCVNFDISRFNLFSKEYPILAGDFYRPIEQLYQDYQKAVKSSFCQWAGGSGAFESFYVGALSMGFAVGRAASIDPNASLPTDMANLIVSDLDGARGGLEAFKSYFSDSTRMNSRIDQLKSRIPSMNARQADDELAGLYKEIQAAVRSIKIPQNNPPSAASAASSSNGADPCTSCAHQKCAACANAVIMLCQSDNPECQSCIDKNCQGH